MKMRNRGASNALSATQRMAAFATGLRVTDIPDAVMRLARLHTADAVGVALAAASVPSHRALLTALMAQAPAAGVATVFGLDATTEASNAALMNGLSIHALEYDDTHMGSIVHGSAVVVATALAVAQAQVLTLTQTLRLIVVGWECLVRIGLAAQGAFQQRGFQVTSVAGTVVAAMLAAAARGADTDVAAHAAGIAGSQASGIFEFLHNGASVKALHPGWAAHAGIWAAGLAMAGMTGPMSVLEGRHGIYAAYADDRLAGDRLHHALDDLGRTWTLRDAAFKLYPCCHYIHPYLEAAAQLHAQVGGRRIASARVLVAPEAGLVIAQPWAHKQTPRSPNDAKYSLPYCVARALLGKPVDVTAMTVGPLDPHALDLAKRIHARDWPQSGFPANFGADVAITLEDGQALQARIPQVLGSAQRPATVAQVQQKFLANTGRVLSEARARYLWEAFLTGDTLPFESPRFCGRTGEIDDAVLRRPSSQEAISCRREDDLP